MTDLILLLIRATLAAIFATAGFAKLADIKGAEKAARDFGVSGPLARLGPIVISAAEVAIAVLLLFASWSWIAAIAAAALLAVFIVMMTYQFVRGNAPDCHCFGQLHSEPVGAFSIFRNTAFLVLTSILVFRGPAGQGLSIGDVSVETLPSLLGLAAVLLITGAIVYLRSIAKRQGEMLKRLELLEAFTRDGSQVRRDEAGDPHLGRPIGARFPSFNIPDVSGRPVTLEDLLHPGRPILFIFAAPGCEPCAALVPEIREWKRRLADRVEIVLFTSGSAEENQTKFSDACNTILVEADREIAIAAGGRWTPTAVLVDASGRFASHLAAGDQAIRELVERIGSADLNDPMAYFTNPGHHGRGLKIGQKIPDFELPDIAGRNVGKDAFSGRRLLVAFWSLQCGHCERFLPSLKEWEAGRRNGDPDLIIFSDGAAEEHQSLGFRSPVVLDKGYKVSEKLGMFGTPSAVLIDETGTIVSETAVGAENIWSLIGRK
jgi:peroxiredoxin/uncharacterized membrane protein YphA (DoxX/SURF4 family)